MEPETLLKFLLAVLLALGGAVLNVVWKELQRLRKRTHRVENFSARHEGALDHILDHLGLPPMPEPQRYPEDE